MPSPPSNDLWEIKSSYRYRLEGIFLIFFRPPLVHMIFLEQQAKSFVLVISPIKKLGGELGLVHECLFPGFFPTLRGHSENGILDSEISVLVAKKCCGILGCMRRGSYSAGGRVSAS